MEFTTVRSKEKDYNIYLKSEKLVPSQQLFWRTWQKLLQLFGDLKKWIPAIRRPKNVVHNCQEQGKRL